jgi:hypothetical protein
MEEIRRDDEETKPRLAQLEEMWGRLSLYPGAGRIMNHETEDARSHHSEHISDEDT